MKKKQLNWDDIEEVDSHRPRRKMRNNQDYNNINNINNNHPLGNKAPLLIMNPKCK